MSMATVDYAGSLGKISDSQFDQALRKLGLGSFVKAGRVTGGVVGQNVFLTSTGGEFVFRGRPFYDEQFDVEKFAVDSLRAKTGIPTAYPYIIDNDLEIFGFRYAIMPRLTGIQTMTGGTRILELSKPDRLEIARAMARCLAGMQFRLAPEEYDSKLSDLCYEQISGEAYAQRVIGRTAPDPVGFPGITESDVKYIAGIIEQNRAALTVPFEPCFLHGDFKEDNVLFSHENGEWEVCAVFDFAMSHFGDGETDLSRLFAMYADEDAELTREFIRTYIKLKPPREGFAERLKIYGMQERIGMWYWAKGQGIAWWDEKLTLREWLEFYLNIDL